MKVFRSLIFTFFVCLLAAASISAQQTATAKKSYQNIVVEKFTIRDGVEFPADKIDGLTSSLVNTLTRSNRFNQVTPPSGIAVQTTAPVAATSETVAPTAETVAPTTDAADVPTLKITGEVIKYVKGSRAARYVIGFGAGKTKIITDIKFIDVKTGEVVHQQTVDGDVTWGLFGGSSEDAKGGVADEIIRVMKKNGFAGEKIKKTK